MLCFRCRLCDVQWSLVGHGAPDFEVPLRYGLDYCAVFYVVCWWLWAFLKGFRARVDNFLDSFF